MTRVEVSDPNENSKSVSSTLTKLDLIHLGLPLNPTKQDFAFGEHEHGEKWQNNLTLRISAVTKLYYEYYLEKLCGGRKSKLTQMVKKLTDKAIMNRERLTHASSNSYFKSIGQLEIPTFKGIKWKYNSQYQNIAVVAKKDITAPMLETKREGDLILKERSTVKKKTQQGKTPAKVSPSKSSPTQNLDENETVASSRRTSSRIAAISNSSKKRYIEDDNIEETEEVDSIRKVSKSTTAKRKKVNESSKELTKLQLILENKEKELEDAKLDVEVLEKQLGEKDLEISRMSRIISKLERKLERYSV